MEVLLADPKLADCQLCFQMHSIFAAVASIRLCSMTDGCSSYLQVLGELEGAPGWHEVMDMASGKVYFWDSTTNGVAWDPPDGSHPRSTSLQHEHELQAQRDSQAALDAANPTESVQQAPATSELEGPADVDADIRQLGRRLVSELADALLARMGPNGIPDLLHLAIQAELRLQDYQALTCLFRRQQEHLAKHSPQVQSLL